MSAPWALSLLALAQALACGATPPPTPEAPPAPAAPASAPTTVTVVSVAPPPPSPPAADEPLPPAKPAVQALASGTGSAEDRALADGDRALDAGDLVTALRNYEAARGLAPKDAAPLVGLARVRVQKTDLPLDYAAGKGNADVLAARSLASRAVQLDGAFAPAELELGRVLLLLGDADGATASLRRAAELAPREAEVHSVLGVAALATGHADVALTELALAAKLDMGSAARHGNLGTALLMNGKVAEAVKEYELQVRLADKDARAHSDLGTALLAGSGGDADLGRGIAELRRALTLDPTRATFHSNLGYALQLQGSRDDAIAEYRRALSIDPRLASAWINLATALAKDPKQRGEARKALGEARKIDPSDPRVRANEQELDALEQGRTVP
jgi:Flp pilus assembly protein TadD